MAMQHAEDRAKDQARQLLEAQQKVASLTGEVDLARQEIERIKRDSAAALTAANARARAHAAALSKDLRAARKVLQQRDVLDAPGG